MAGDLIGYRILRIGNSAVAGDVCPTIPRLTHGRRVHCFTASTAGSARWKGASVTPERWQSGRMRALGKRVNSQGFRGFESLPLRQPSPSLRLAGQLVDGALAFEHGVIADNCVFEGLKLLLVVAPE